MTLHVDPTVVLPPFQSSMENHCQFSTFSAHSAGRAAGGALITLLLLSDDRFPALNGGRREPAVVTLTERVSDIESDHR